MISSYSFREGKLRHLQVGSEDRPWEVGHRVDDALGLAQEVGLGWEVFAACLGVAPGACLASREDQWAGLAQVAEMVAVAAGQVPVPVTYVGQFPRPYP
jgi:hypothetical protein